MQITMSADRNHRHRINLSRYAGSANDGGTRKSYSTRVGSFPADVLPEFNTSLENQDPRRIPYDVYRATTPDEHDEIVQYVKELRLAELSEQVRAVVSSLESVLRVAQYGELKESDRRALIDGCKSTLKALSREARKANAVTKAAPKSSIPTVATREGLSVEQHEGLDAMPASRPPETAPATGVASNPGEPS